MSDNDTAKANIKNVVYDEIRQQTIIWEQMYQNAMMFQKVNAPTVYELKEWVVNTFNAYFDYYNMVFKNLTAEQEDFIKRFNFDNEMADKLEQAGYIKYHNGAVVIANTIKNSQVVPVVLELVGRPEYRNGELVSVYCTQETIASINQTEQMLVFKFHKTETGKVVLTHYAAPKGTKINKIEADNLIPITGNESFSQYVYDRITYLPLQIFKANARSDSICNNAKSSFDQYGYYKEQINMEWKYIRSQLLVNRQVAPTSSARDVQKKIEDKDRRAWDFTDPDATLNEIFQIVAGTGVSAEIAFKFLNHLKSEIEQKLFMVTRTEGKNNKHTAEAVNDNVAAYSFIWALKMRFSQELSRYYSKTLDMIQKYTSHRLGKLPPYVECDVQLARPLETLLNLDADSQEKDNETLEIKKTGTENNNAQSAT